MDFCLFNGDVSEHENESLPMYAADNHVPISPSKPRSRFNQKQNPRQFITLFGRTRDSRSIAIVINDWLFHWFIKLSPLQAADPERCVAELQKKFPRGLRIELVSRFQAVGFSCTPDGTRDKKLFLRLSFSSTQDAFFVRSWLTSQGDTYTLCEADTFMSPHCDVFILAQLLEHLSLPDRPCSWFSWLAVQDIDSRCSSRYTHCFSEFIVSVRQLRLLPPEVFIPRMRVLSFDIECYSDNDNVFPKADSCPVIAIGNAVYEFDPCGDGAIVSRSCFSFAPRVERKESSVLDYEHRIFSSELAMLEAWRNEIVLRGDFDIIVGYNIWKFDVPYLLERMHILCPTSSFFRLGRILKTTSCLNIGSFSSAASGDNDQSLLRAPGLAEIDVFLLAKKRKGFSSFKLGAVAAVELDGLSKLDFPHTEINRCFRENDPTSIATYCVRDTELPLLLMQRWGSLDELLAVSRATYTPISSLASAGQTVKVRNMLFQTAHSLGFVFNALQFPAAKCQGATVITPVPGYYLDHVATLDYNSLYPKCIVMGNLCSSTLVIPENPPHPAALPHLELRNIAVGNTVGEPRTHCFVQSVPGILPLMLTRLLEARSLTKRLLADAKKAGRADESRQLDYRQLALKLCANSAYGYCNSQGMYRCLPIAESTTRLGRDAIETAKQIAEGPPYCGTVIYGDTDSIMIRLPGNNSLAEASVVAGRIAQHVTEHYMGQLVLEPEKIYNPYLLAKKKRYCGLMYTSPTAQPTVPDCKGFEIVRKDTFPYCHDFQASLFSILVAPLCEDSVQRDEERERRYGAALELVRRTVDALQQRRVSPRELVSSKSLRRDYKNETAIVQAVVNKQIATRTPGREFPPGDRVPFLVVSGHVHIEALPELPRLLPRTSGLADRAIFVDFFEEFSVFRENLDWIYYIERLRPTALQVMELVDPARRFLVEDVFSRAIAVLQRQRTLVDLNQRDISSFFMGHSSAISEKDGAEDPPVLFTAPSQCCIAPSGPRFEKPSPQMKRKRVLPKQSPSKKPSNSLLKFFSPK